MQGKEKINIFDRLSKDMLIYLALELDLPVLLRTCRVNKRFNRIVCENNDFWRTRFIEDFKEFGVNLDDIKEGLLKDLTWKQIYQIKHYELKYKGGNLLLETSQRGDIEGVKTALLVVSDHPDVMNKYDEKALVVGHPAPVVMTNIPMLTDDINYSDFNGHSALMIAVYKGHLEIVKLLLNKGANVNHVNNIGSNSLSLYPSYDIGRLLIDYGIDVNHISKTGWTPLMSASEGSNIGLIKMLLESGADVNYIFNGFTAIKLARTKKIKKLLKRYKNK